MHSVEVVSSQEMADSWNVLIWLEQRESKNILKEKKHLMLKQSEKLLTDGTRVTHIILGSRVKLFPIGYSGKDDIPFLPRGKLADLVAQKYHYKFHVDIDSTVCHIRNFIFIPQLRKIVSQIDRNCIFCKLKRKRFEGQIMGELPDVRTSMSPPFSNVQMDLFGPFTIKDDCIKRGSRVHKKVWGVIFVCCSTRAVQLDVAVSYETESILHCIRRLQSLRGNVQMIVSDPGSQLVGASRELREWRHGWSELELSEFGSKNGITWSFISANSQHQNGGAEIMVKLAKGVTRAWMHELGKQIFTLNELNTILFETTNHW